MKQILHLFLFGFLFVSFTYAQSDSQKCPSISVEGPSAAPRPVDKIPFKVILSNYFDYSSLKYEWSVDNGKILNGQGTRSIIIDQSGLNITSLTATVTIIGLPESCPNTYSESFITHCGVERVLINEYQKLTSAEENKKLDTLIIAMNGFPAVKGFIQKTFPSNQNKVNIYQNLKRILDYLKSQNIDTNSITFGVAYGKNIEETKLYLIPPGADNPEIEGETLKSKDISERLAATKSSTQAKITLSCPTISVTSPDSIPLPDEPFSIIAGINKEYDTSNLKYLWTVSAGKIVGGQGTLKVSIDRQNNEMVTATLEIQGLPANCVSTFTESFICADCNLHTVFIDEYNRISFNEEKLRLNKLADELQNNPYPYAFVVKLFPPTVSRIAVYRDLQRVISYLQSKGSDTSRIIFNLGYNETYQTKIFTIPPGVEQPSEWGNETLNAEQLAAKIKSVKTSSRKKPRRKN